MSARFLTSIFSSTRVPFDCPVEKPPTDSSSSFIAVVVVVLLLLCIYLCCSLVLFTVASSSSSSSFIFVEMDNPTQRPRPGGTVHHTDDAITSDLPSTFLFQLLYISYIFQKLKKKKKLLRVLSGNFIYCTPPPFIPLSHTQSGDECVC